jgi:hypothetical protein
MLARLEVSIDGQEARRCDANGGHFVPQRQLAYFCFLNFTGRLKESWSSVSSTGGGGKGSER